MSNLEAWKAKSRRDVVLPSGTTVTIQLTTIRDELLAGRFSGPVLVMARQMESNTFEANRELGDEELEAFSHLRWALIAATVVAVDGEPIELQPEDVMELPMEDQDDLWLYAMRLKRLPQVPKA